nr:helix-turn-helix transcriptional regulator [Mucilaginibacter roseus]
MVRSSVALIIELKGRQPIGELTGKLPVSRRQLERRFSTAVGLSPKQLSKMVRLQTSLKMLSEGQFSCLGDVAYDNDFYDQSHFINDFKEFTGLSPKEYYAGNLRMAMLFSSS